MTTHYKQKCNLYKDKNKELDKNEKLELNTL